MNIACRPWSPQHRRNNKVAWIVFAVTCSVLSALLASQPWVECMTAKEQQRLTNDAVSSLDRMAAQVSIMHKNRGRLYTVQLP
jgi:hypothetical protein